MTNQPSLVIRGGTVVDGTGGEPFIADVAIKGRTISAIGKDLPVRGMCEVDATGKIVTPGWVDAHTHFDAQATWDPYCTPSTGNGVTTLAVGNCGVGFAPCQESLRDFLVDLMDSVEDIPGSALHEGIRWEWETFPEYLEALSRREFACDVGVFIGHGPIRTWVLGNRASCSDRPGGPENDPVLPHEIERMAKVVEEAVAAGALGFSTSRQLLHRDKSGVLTPGSLASSQEMLAIGNAIVAAGGGVFQLANDYSTYDDVPPEKRDPEKVMKHFNDEWRWINKLAVKNPDKLTITTGVGTGMSKDTADWHRHMFKRLDWIKKKGGNMIGQVMTRFGGVHYSLSSGVHPFLLSNTYNGLVQEIGNDIQKLTCRMSGTSLRRTIIAETRAEAKKGKHPAMGALMAVLGWPEMIFPWCVDYEPAEEQSLRSRAKHEGKSLLECTYDLLIQIDASHAGILWKPLYNYGTMDGEPIREMLLHERVVPGFADAGAHVRFVCDATSPTHLLTHWVRDRTRGARVPIEQVVRKHTAATAALLGLADRGELRPGMKADLNVIDLEKLKLLPPEWVTDLPLGAGRWVQRVEGYQLTVISGEVTYENGVPTGALPGCLVRNPRRIGLQGSLKGSVLPAQHAAVVSDIDLTEHALEISKSKTAGASAVGRTLRATPTDSKTGRSRL